MKKFFKEFKTFISRGNVMDMAVGVIIGGAFSAIVSALTNHVLMPVVNWFLLIVTGGNGLDSVYTYLKKVEVTEGGETVIDTANSIFIDWGAFITAIINFVLIALVLFLIVKAINKVAEANKKIKKEVGDATLNRAERKELKQNGVDIRDKAAVKAYFAEKAEREAQEAEKAKAEAEEKAKAERLLNPTVEDLLKDIKTILEEKDK